MKKIIMIFITLTTLTTLVHANDEDLTLSLNDNNNTKTETIKHNKKSAEDILGEALFVAFIWRLLIQAAKARERNGRRKDRQDALQQYNRGEITAAELERYRQALFKKPRRMN